MQLHVQAVKRCKARTRGGALTSKIKLMLAN